MDVNGVRNYDADLRKQRDFKKTGRKDMNLVLNVLGQQASVSVR